MRKQKSDTILAIDVGNSNIKAAIYSEGKLLSYKRIETHPHPTEDSFALVFAQYCKYSVSMVAVASVVPAVDDVLCAYCTKTFGISPVFINALYPSGIKYMVPDPMYIGADLIANLHAARQLSTQSCIIIDMGTATKIQLWGSDHLYAGVAIAAGLYTSAKTLIESAAKLTEYEPELPHSLLGNTTSSALNSGLVGGHAFMIDAFVHKIKLEYPHYAPFTTVLTGGYSHLLAPMISYDLHSPYFTLDGIYAAGLLIGEA